MEATLDVFSQYGPTGLIIFAVMVIGLALVRRGTPLSEQQRQHMADLKKERDRAETRARRLQVELDAALTAHRLAAGKSDIERRDVEQRLADLQRLYADALHQLDVANSRIARRDERIVAQETMIAELSDTLARVPGQRKDQP